jgi:hypothetical protein
MQRDNIRGAMRKRSERDSNGLAIWGYIERMRELTNSVARRNRKIHSANGQTGSAPAEQREVGQNLRAS